MHPCFLSCPLACAVLHPSFYTTAPSSRTLLEPLPCLMPCLIRTERNLETEVIQNGCCAIRLLNPAYVTPPPTRAPPSSPPAPRQPCSRTHQARPSALARFTHDAPTHRHTDIPQSPHLSCPHITRLPSSFRSPAQPPGTRLRPAVLGTATPGPPPPPPPNCYPHSTARRRRWRCLI